MSTADVAAEAERGVVVVVRGEAPLENVDLALLQAMLAAVGLDGGGGGLCGRGWFGEVLPCKGDRQGQQRGDDDEELA